MIVALILLGISYLFLSIELVRTNRSAAMFLLVFLLYFYTFHAFVLIALSEVFPPLAELIPLYYGYPFYVEVDDIFVSTVVSYLLFANFYLLVLWAFARGARPIESTPGDE